MTGTSPLENITTRTVETGWQCDWAPFAVRAVDEDRPRRRPAPWPPLVVDEVKDGMEVRFLENHEYIHPGCEDPKPGTGFAV